MPEKLRKFLKHEVAIGNYSNESEVVRDLVRRNMESKYNASREKLIAELELGMKDVREGRGGL